MKKATTIILILALLCGVAYGCTCGVVTMQERIALYKLADGQTAEIEVTLNTAIYADTKGDYDVTLAIVKALYNTAQTLSEEDLEAIAEYLHCDCGGDCEVEVTPELTVTPTPTATAKPSSTKKTCTHNIDYINITNSTHTKHCTKCNKTADPEAHTYVDGVCSVCSHTCTHEWEDGTCKYCGKMCAHAEWVYSSDDASYCLKVCKTCGKTWHDKNAYHVWSRYNSTTFQCTRCGRLAYDNGTFKESNTTTKTCGCSATCTCPEGECKCKNCGCKNKQDNEQDSEQ